MHTFFFPLKQTNRSVSICEHITKHRSTQNNVVSVINAITPQKQTLPFV